MDRSGYMGTSLISCLSLRYKTRAHSQSFKISDSLKSEGYLLGKAIPGFKYCNRQTYLSNFHSQGSTDTVILILDTNGLDISLDNFYWLTLSNNFLTFIMVAFLSVFILTPHLHFLCFNKTHVTEH